MASPPVISAKGKPFECGRQYGSQARELIRRNVQVYFDMWRTLWQAERPDILKQCQQLVPVIGEYAADLMEELQGIAEGADLSLEEVVALNARYEINASRGLVCPPDGCTSVATLPQVNQDGHTFLGQNWDWLPRFKGLNVVLEVAPEGQPGIVTQPEAGVLAHRGMNSAGLGVCFNGLTSHQDSFTAQAPPFLVMARAILSAENLSQALKAIMRAGATLSGNFLIAQGDGEAIDIEVSPADIGAVYPDGGILTHSNHFIALANREDLHDVLKQIYPDTLYRHHRAQHLLEPEKGHIDVGSFQRVLRDHFSAPQAICRHADPQAEGIQQWATLSSMIMDLTERAIYIAEGYPCQHEYLRLTPKVLWQD
jgi:isopenicillin-N N-acyltransferase-like protein